MSHAPEDGERIAPKGYTSLATLEAHASMITAAQAEGLQMRMPLGMREAGWIVLPSGGTLASHRLDYAYIEKSAEEQQEARHAAASVVAETLAAEVRAAIKLGGKAPAVAGASFIAPSANLVGAVVMGEGASAWYGAMIKGGASAAEIGELSSVGDRAVVVDSILGKCVHVGAGAIVTGAKIADESSIGMGCKVGKGASIGSGAALAAGSVLPPGASVPAGQLWGGIPAKKISDLGADAAAAMVRTCEVTCDLGKLHMDESWKELDLVEEEAEDRKREKTRTPERLETMRDDPKWVPMPSLGEHLAKMGVHSHTHVPP